MCIEIFSGKNPKGPPLTFWQNWPKGGPFGLKYSDTVVIIRQLQRAQTILVKKEKPSTQKKNASFKQRKTRHANDVSGIFKSFAWRIVFLNYYASLAHWKNIEKLQFIPNKSEKLDYIAYFCFVHSLLFLWSKIKIIRIKALNAMIDALSLAETY